MTIPEIKKTEKNASGDNPDAVERVARTETGDTKGPWEYDDNHRVWDISGCDSEAIATCSTSANARLIAAAPELLEALQNIEANLTGRDYMKERIESSLRYAREAIEKATK